ncbi:MAG: hypothetical protein ACE5EI_03730 [Thermodesulfobacteriota bacterium]
MRKIPFILVGLVLFASMAHAGYRVTSEYLAGETSATRIDPESGKLSTVPVRVYVLIGKRDYYDDLTYIVADPDGRKSEAFLMERGLPGFPNIATRQERKKFLRALGKGKVLLGKALKEGLDKEQPVGSFVNFNLYLVPGPEGGQPRLKILMSSLESKEKAVLYMDKEGLDGLMPLVKEAGERIKTLKEERTKRREAAQEEAGEEE